jgi:hypothetical protein
MAGYLPFPSLQHAAAWCYYHANFVARSFLPRFLAQMIHGIETYFGWDSGQQQAAKKIATTTLNAMAKYFPLLAPHSQ